MAHSDTTKEAHQILIAIYKQMTPAVKMRRIFDAYRTGKILAMAWLKLSYPDATEEQIWQLWARKHLGDELFEQVYSKNSEHTSDKRNS